MQSQTGELTYVKVDYNNLPLTLEVQHRIWPHEGVDEDYLAKPLHSEDLGNVPWLVLRFYYGAERKVFRRIIR